MKYESFVELLADPPPTQGVFYQVLEQRRCCRLCHLHHSSSQDVQEGVREVQVIQPKHTLRVIHISGGGARASQQARQTSPAVTRPHVGSRGHLHQAKAQICGCWRVIFCAAGGVRLRFRVPVQVTGVRVCRLSRHTLTHVGAAATRVRSQVCRAAQLRHGVGELRRRRDDGGGRLSRFQPVHLVHPQTLDNRTLLPSADATSLRFPALFSLEVIKGHVLILTVALERRFSAENPADKKRSNSDHERDHITQMRRRRVEKHLYFLNS